MDTTVSTDLSTLRQTPPAREALGTPSLWRSEWRKLLGGLLVFVVFLMLPIEWSRLGGALVEALALTRWYAREHVLLCLIPAFFVAGAIAAFLSRATVMKYLGPDAPKWQAYGVASVSGTILAVCSCTVLPLFAGIWRMGAGLGPATAFLYSGPAINVLAIILTVRVLGVRLGLARAIGAVVFSIVIGLAMHLIYRKEEAARSAAAPAVPDDGTARPLWRTALYFAAMIGILVFANWGKPEQTAGLWHAIWSAKWLVTSAFAVALAVMLVAWFGVGRRKMLLVGLATILAWAVTKWLLVPAAGGGSGHGLPWAALVPFAVAVIGLSIVISTGRRTAEANDWFNQTWTFAKQIAPLLLVGVLVAGFLLGRPGEQGLIPGAWVAGLVGGNSIRANLASSVLGAFMYFATLTEVPILQGLIGAGMGKGPALALLLAGPALSLPNMLVIRSIMGTQKTLVFVSLVIVMATLSGMIYGSLF